MGGATLVLLNLNLGFGGSETEADVEFGIDILGAGKHMHNESEPQHMDAMTAKHHMDSEIDGS